MQTGFGNAGWVEVTDAIGIDGPIYFRLLPDDKGLWTVREVYVHSERLTAAMLRRAPIADVELQVNADPSRLASRLDSPGPDLHRLVGWFSGRFGAGSDHWIAQSMWAQVKGSGVTQAPAASRRASWSAPDRQPLSAPEHLDEAFFRELARAYVDVVGRKMRPAVVLSAEAGVSPRTVHRWIFEARKGGFLPPGTQGRAGL